MPKIPNWTPAAMKSDWTHDKKRHTVKIREAGRGLDGYEVYLKVAYTDRQAGESGTLKQEIGYSQTFDDAKKMAVDWMRDHPHSIRV